MAKETYKAFLTIDDITSDNTKAIIDYLCEKGIRAVLFAWGERVERNSEAAIYALQKGMIIGNHSYSHPQFSSLTVEEGIAEIEKCEEVLNKLYKDAGVERTYRPFRFPYGDKGGDNKEAYQEYFRSHGFSKLDDRGILMPWWSEQGMDQEIDTFWTFDFAEYNIRVGSDFTKEDVMDKIAEYFSRLEDGRIDKASNHFFLIHAHDETEELVPDYYKLFLEDALNRGVEFVKPTFIEAK